LHTSTFVADFYILSHQPASIYKPGAVYTFTDTTPWSFNVGVAKNSSGAYYSNLDFISVNGATIPSDGSAPSPVTVNQNQITPVPYVDPTQSSSSVEYMLSVIDEASFDVDNAIGTKTTKAAIAQMTLANTTSGTSYGVYIKFKDSNNDTTFSLGLDGSKDIYTIDYTLKFLSQNVEGGVPILWDSLTEGINQKDILVTGISQSQAELAPAGDYSDTITISVTPIDTL
jgi:hypothetical protein